MSDPTYGYCAYFLDSAGYFALDICGYAVTEPGRQQETTQTNGKVVHEPRTIAGRPAIVSYSPAGPMYDRFVDVRVEIYDAASGAAYWISGSDPSLRGDNVAAVVAIARSLFESPNPR